MDITLIPVREEDRHFFRRVHHESYRDTIESIFTWDDAEQDRFADADFDHRNPQIILCGDEKCGIVGIQDKGDHIRFGPIWLLPSFQGRGIGTYVVRLFMDQALREKRPLKLQTLKVNLRAKHLYERLGFLTTGSGDIYWDMEYAPI